MKLKSFYRYVVFGVLFAFFIFLLVLFHPFRNFHVTENPQLNNQIKSFNRLGFEKSPYLLQHKDNPVWWYPWGEEAFKAAEEQNKPVFLSIGYSTCHWCHVMAHESFEDESVAALINQYFIAVKVDREERPDIDQVYMKAVMAMTGHGGWPLTVFLTPDKKPFYGGTYFPPHAKWGQPGLVDILESIHQNWKSQKSKILDSSISLTNSIFLDQQNLQGGELTKDILFRSFAEFKNSFDMVEGGFGSSPKFPTSHNLSFLLRYWKRSGNTEALKIVDLTLRKMAKGGMYDHLGGGFHRYSTDRQWQVPHFEKMLYDQALLAMTYLEMYQVTKDEFYRETAQSILDYVLRDMTRTEGGFYSAEDADSFEEEGDNPLSGTASKKEGAFYVWRHQDIVQLLGGNAEVFNFHYDIQLDGNALSDPHQEFTGKNIIWEVKTVSETAIHFGKSEENVKEILKASRAVLYEARKLRSRPHLDDKILTDWNGLMIAAFSYAGRILNEDRYVVAAKKSAEFILDELVDKNGKLLHRFRDSDAAISAHLDDYAFFVHGLIELYYATFEEKYILKAEEFSKNMLKHFSDDENGGFYFVADDAEELISREKEIYDGAIPSGNSVAALNLLRLYHMTFESVWEENAQKLFRAFANKVKQRPSAYSQLLMAFDFMLGSTKEIVISGDVHSKDLELFTNVINETFMPSAVFVLNSPEENHTLKNNWEYLKSKNSIDGKLTVYVCENKECQAPTTDVKVFETIINQGEISFDE